MSRYNMCCRIPLPNDNCCEFERYDRHHALSGTRGIPSSSPGIATCISDFRQDCATRSMLLTVFCHRYEWAVVIHLYNMNYVTSITFKIYTFTILTRLALKLASQHFLRSFVNF